MAGWECVGCGGKTDEQGECPCSRAEKEAAKAALLLRLAGALAARTDQIGGFPAGWVLVVEPGGWFRRPVREWRFFPDLVA
jgi:hypothetical protein